MSRRNLLAIFVLTLSLALTRIYWSGYDKNQVLWQGLLQFSDAAEQQLTNKPVPDLKYWRSQRTETIRRLSELREKLDNVCFYTNCGKAAGSGMGILCALTSISGFLMSLLGIPISVPVMGVGGLMCPTGYLTRETSIILELILSQKYQNELQTVLIKDTKLSRSLNEWLEFSPNLEAEFKNIFGFDFKSKNSMFFIMLNEFQRLLTLTKNFQKSVSQLKSGKYSSFLGKDIQLDDLYLFSKQIQDSPEISNKIRKSLSFLSDMIKISRSFNENHQKFRVKNMLTTVSSILNKLDIKIPSKIATSAFLSLRVLELAKHVSSFIDETKIIKDGKCPYSDSLKHIIDMLNLELTMIESSFPFI